MSEMKGWAIAKSPEEFLARGFDRKDWADIDLVLIIRPGSDLNTTTELLGQLLETLTEPPRTLN